MKIACPKFDDVFNGILKRLGGKEITEDDKADMEAYKKGLSPEELAAYHKAYFHWNAQNGDGVKIHSYLDAQDDLRNKLPSEMIRNLPKGTKIERDVLGKLVDGVRKIVNPEIADLTPEDRELYRESVSGDMKGWEKHIWLPSEKGKQDTVWGRFWKQIGTVHMEKRTEARNRMNYAYRKMVEPFITLKGEKAIADVTDIFFGGEGELGERYGELLKAAKSAKGEGDKQRFQKAADDLKTLNRYSDEELKKGIKAAGGRVIKLDGKGIEAYKSLRQTYDLINKTKYDLQENEVLAKYQKQKWYRVLESAFATQLKNNDIKTIIDPLRAAAETAKTPLRVNVEQIFKNLSAGLNELTPQERASVNATYEKLHGTLSIQLDELKKAISETTGETDDKRLTATTKEMLGAYMNSAEAMNEITEMRKKEGNIIAYAPHIREKGTNKLQIVEDIKTQDKEGTEKVTTAQRFSRMYSNESEFAGIVKELRANRDFYDESGKIKEGLRRKTDSSKITKEESYTGISDSNMMNVITNAIEKMKDRGEDSSEHLEAVRKSVLQAVADEQRARGAAAQNIRRQQGGSIKGYKLTNLKEFTDNYITGFSGWVTKQVAARESLEILSGISKQGDLPETFEDISKYVKDQLSNTGGKLENASSTAKTIATVCIIGANVRVIVTHAFQNATIGAPAFDQWMRENKIKGVSAIGTLGKAMKDIVAMKLSDNKIAAKYGDFDINKLDSIPEADRKAYLENGMLQEGHQRGDFADTYTRELLGQIEGRKGQAFSTVSYWLMKPFSEMISTNRQGASLGMFRVSYAEEIKKGATPEAAYEKAAADAKNLSNTAHFIFGKGNHLRVASGGEMSEIAVNTAMSFRMYTANYVNWFLGQADWRARAMSLGYMAVWGGLMSLPLVKGVMDEIEKRTGFNIRKKVQDTFKGIGGDKFAELGMYGLPAAAGANLSGSMAIGLPFLGERPGDTAAGNVAGVWGSLYGKAEGAMQAAGNKDWWRAGELLMPNVISSPSAAIRMATSPTTTAAGRPLYDSQGKPLQLGIGQAAVRAGGIQPTGYAEEMAKANDVRVVEKYFSDQHKNIESEYQVARNKKDPSAVTDLIKNITNYNRDIQAKGAQGLVKPTSLSKILAATKAVPTTKQRHEELYLGRE
jgi:CRISPR/Cas system-associated endoribonuclease Cas2